MTDQGKRMLIRCMSIANGLLINTGSDHRMVINAYQKLLADAWGIDEGDTAHREEFMEMAEEISDTIAAKYTDYVPERAGKPPRGN
jgi:hypothetical protein